MTDLPPRLSWQPAGMRAVLMLAGLALRRIGGGGGGPGRDHPDLAGAGHRGLLVVRSLRTALALLYP